jgi:hypothetical protein
LSVISEALANCNTLKQKQGGRKGTMGHGLHDYKKRHGGKKMRIEFTVGVKRPKDPVQATKLSSEVGFYTRNKMPIATHWK